MADLTDKELIAWARDCVKAGEPDLWHWEDNLGALAARLETANRELGELRPEVEMLRTEAAGGVHDPHDQLEALYAELRDERDEARSRVAELEAEALRFYKADGSFEELESAEAVVRRRVEAAKLLDRVTRERREQPGGWQPIEECEVYEGREVMGWLPDEGRRMAVRWTTPLMGWGYPGSCGLRVTLFQELPAPPQAETSEAAPAGAEGGEVDA